jgi:hypothetical protein
MKSLVLGSCSPDTTFSLTDPDALSETELEAYAVRALNCLFPKYTCFLFGGGFVHEGVTHRPDLAMVARDFSHWFVIEVELLSHSLRDHVMPQVCAFRYGDPQPDCVSILSRELSIDRSRAETLLVTVPKNVAVVINRWDDNWFKYLDAHSIQVASVQHYKTSTGSDAVQMEGYLHAPTRSLGFGTYSAVDQSIRIAPAQPMHEGTVQLYAPDGTPSLWTSRADGSVYWLTKTKGAPTFPDQTLLQIVVDARGALSIRLPSR